MKRVSIAQIFSCACAIALLAGCRITEVEIKDEGTDNTGRTLTASAVADENVQTKGYWHYVDGAVMPFYWTGSETLTTGIYPKGGEDWYELKGAAKVLNLGVEVNADDSGHATLVGKNLSNDAIVAGDFIYFTNGSVTDNNPSKVEFTLPDNFIQVGTDESCLSDYMYIYGQSEIQSADENSVVAGNVVFRHVPSTFSFNLNNKSGTELNIMSMKISVTDLNNDAVEIFPKSYILTVDPESAETPMLLSENAEAGKYSEITLEMKSSETAAFYTLADGGTVRANVLTMPASFSNEEITVSVLYKDLSEYTDLTTKKPTKSLESGHIYVMDIDVTEPPREPEPPTILSADGTANTYVVNKAAARYCFDATVKGNGVARSYSWNDNGSMRSASYSDVEIAPASAKLVWYNTPLTEEGISHLCPVVIKSVLYNPEDGMIYFETPKTFVEGNVVIAAYDADGSILWSWNIWAVENYEIENSTVAVGRYTFMDRNLGAIRGPEVMDGTERSAAWAIGNYYQWGRKDPFPAAAECKDYDNNWGLPTFTPIVELQQDFSSQSWGSNDMMFGNVLKDNVYAIGRHVGENFTISEAVESGVKYPYKWVTSGPNDGVDENMKWRPDQSYSWMMNGSLADEYVTDWHYLWGNPGADDDRQKSIYDPCPAGWEIACPGALKAALESASEDKAYGMVVNGLYFPNAGFRKASFGGSPIISVGATMSLGCSGFSSGDRVHPYRGTKGGLITSDAYAGVGYQIRCVKELPKVPVSGGDLSAEGGKEETDWFK